MLAAIGPVDPKAQIAELLEVQYGVSFDSPHNKLVTL